MRASTRERPGAPGSNSSRPCTSLKWPRTQVTIMWRTENPAAVWPGSKVQELTGSRASGGPPVEVLEARELLEEGQLHGARGAVALLADDDLGQAAVLV